jgi:ABC-type uncharacterized transport system auxiliary subunit
MKKTLFLALALAFTLAACGGKKKPATTDHKAGSGSAMHDGSAAHGSGDGSAAPAPTP